MKLKQVLNGLKQLGGLLLLSFILSIVMDLWRGQNIPQDNFPPIEGVSIQGVEVDVLAQSYEQAVVVYYWGTWCPVCKFVSPAVDTISQYYPVVSIAMSSGNEQRVMKYMDHQQYSFTVLNDPKSEIAQAWSVQMTPTIMIFKNGELSYYTIGFTSLPGIWWRLLFS